jgi:hypothetical protein
MQYESGVDICFGRRHPSILREGYSDVPALFLAGFD